MRQKLPWLIVIAILALACLVRFFRLGEVPIELNRDEAALGYNAYSLLLTGRDEHGVSWPISLESFGDWKLPGYVYTLIPFVKVFGLTNWAVRLPSALAGVALVGAAMALAWQLAVEIFKDKQQRWWLVWLSGLMMTISPWNIHLSHVAYEANLAGAMLAWGIVLINWGWPKVVKKEKWGWAMTAGGGWLLGLSTITYHAFQIVTPLLVLFWLASRRQQLFTFIKSKNLAKLPLFITLIGLALPLSIYLLAGGEANNQVKFSGLSIFDTGIYRQQYFQNQIYFQHKFALLNLIYSWSPERIINQISENTFLSTSPEFLIFNGGGHGSHDVAGTGKIYLAQLPFLLLGIWFCLKKREKPTNLLLFWAVSALIPAIITFQPAHAIRLSALQLPIALLTGLGLLSANKLIVNWSSIKKNLAIFFLAGLWVLSIFNFVVTYFLISPVRDIANWPWQMKTIAAYVQQHQDEYNRIIVDGTNWSPYIFFLLKNQIDPIVAHTTTTYYPHDGEGFQHVQQLGKLEFAQEIDWDANEPKMDRILYIVRENQIPGDKFVKPQYHIVQKLTQPTDNTSWVLFRFDPP